MSLLGAAEKILGWFFDKGGAHFNPRHPDFGCVGDGKQILDGAITTGTAAFASASAAFTVADVGKKIVVKGAGASAGYLSTSILAFVDASHVTLAANAGTTVAGASAVYGTEDGPGLVAVFAAAIAAAGTFPFAGLGAAPQIDFGSGIYMCSSVGSLNLPVPVAGANFTTLSTLIQYNLYMNNVTGLRVIGKNAIIQSTTTNGGEVILFDGPRDILWDGVEVRSVYAMDVAGNDLTSGMNAIAVTSTTRDADGLVFNFRTQDTFSALYIFGDPTSAFRVRNVKGNIRHFTGGYSLATHDNGDNLDITLRSVGVKRDYFCYGVDQHTIQLQQEAGIPGFNACLIKAYDRDTTNIFVKARFKRNATTAKILFSSQHAPAVQATPNKLRNIHVDVDDTSTTGTSIEFDYYRDAVRQATSSGNLLYDGIVLSGHIEGGMSVFTIQSPRGYLNIDDLLPNAGTIYQVLQNSGFFTDLNRTYTPVLQFGGAAVGMTYSAQQGEFVIKGNMVHVFIRITLTAKGSSVGLATVSLPATLSTYTSALPVIHGMGFGGMAALTSSILGFVTGTTLSLRQQGAAAVANITDANFTNTSDIILQVAYPV